MKMIFQNASQLNQVMIMDLMVLNICTTSFNLLSGKMKSSYVSKVLNTFTFSFNTTLLNIKRNNKRIWDAFEKISRC